VLDIVPAVRVRLPDTRYIVPLSAVTLALVIVGAALVLFIVILPVELFHIAIPAWLVPVALLLLMVPPVMFIVPTLLLRIALAVALLWVFSTVPPCTRSMY
jgi:hypothetical protein